MKHKELTFESKEQPQPKLPSSGVDQIILRPIRVEYMGGVGYVTDESQVADMENKLEAAYYDRQMSRIRSMSYSDSYSIGTRNPYGTGVRLVPPSHWSTPEVEKVVEKMLYNLNGKWVTLTKGWWLFKKLISVWAIDMNKPRKELEFYKRYEFKPLIIKPKKELKFAK